MSTDSARRKSAISAIAAIAVGTLAACSDPRYTRIDDMEGSADQLPWTAPAGATAGHWSSYVNGQCEKITPVPDYDGGTWYYEAVAPAYETLLGVSSSHAIHFQTLAPLINVYDAGFGVDLARTPGDGSADPLPPACSFPPAMTLSHPARTVDLSAYRGFTFWGKATKTPETTTKIWIVVSDANTDPRGGVCVPDDVSTDRCFASYRAEVQLDATFSRYTVDFAQLAQPTGWGYHPTPSVLDLKHVYQLAFDIPTPGGLCPPHKQCAGGPDSELSFDVWIDDLFFIDR